MGKLAAHIARAEIGRLTVGGGGGGGGGVGGGDAATVGDAVGDDVGDGVDVGVDWGGEVAASEPFCCEEVPLSAGAGKPATCSSSQC